MKLLEDFERVTAHEIVEKNALLYIAGYVAHKFWNKYSHLGVPIKNLPNLLDDWVFFLSKGNCMYPCPSFQEAAEIMNEEFQNFMAIFSIKKPIFDKLTDIVREKMNNNFPRKVIVCLMRTRTYIRLKEKNKEIVENNLIKRRNRKMYKLCNKKNIENK